jgi:uncharacterized protein (DUF362 family)/NAD-dependent dihydropyrimidine dehydrogenase PreA subunit
MRICGENVAKVSVIKQNSYDHESLYHSIKSSIDCAGGFSPIESAGRNILIKPNILRGAGPEKPVTTHPAFVEAVIILFKEKGFTITVGDSPAVESSSSSAQKCGIMDVVKKHGVKWDDFSDTVEIKNPHGTMINSFKVARAVVHADAIINLPKLKTHTQMYYTGAVKNMFGVVSGLEKARYHLRFPDIRHFAAMIVDLNVCVRSTLSVMDAVIAMDGPGPNNGYPADLGLVLASYDPVALDCAACSIIGYNPEDIPIINDALSRKIWITSPKDIEIKGEKISSVQKLSFKKRSIIQGSTYSRWTGFWIKMLRTFLVKKPFIHKKDCVLCGKCVEICQAGALTFKNNRHKKFVNIDHSKCILCYCCHEVCPYDAIGLKRF